MHRATELLKHFPANSKAASKRIRFTMRRMFRIQIQDKFQFIYDVISELLCQQQQQQHLKPTATYKSSDKLL